MGIERGMDASEPVRPDRIESVADHETLRRFTRTRPVASGTLACPECDIPVGLPGRALAPSEPLECGFCGHAGHVRDFLSLEAPTRPTHVIVRLRMGRPAVSAR